MNKKEQQFLNAAANGDLKMVKTLLKNSVDVNALDGRKTPSNRTALMHASENGHFEIVDLLIDAGARINAVDKGVPSYCPGGNTALILAIQKGHLKVANRLLDAGASPKTKGGGTSVINAAAYLGDEALIKRLLELGADPTQRDGSGFCPIASALNNSKSKIAETLLDLGIDPNSQSPGGGPILLDAIHTGDIKLWRLLIDKGANPELANPDNFTPLMGACVFVKPEAVKLFLSLGVAVNKLDNQKQTALDMIRKQLEPEDLSPEFRKRLIDMGEYHPKPIKELKAIEAMLLKAGGKTSKN